jgi:hypothetical protein
VPNAPSTHEDPSVVDRVAVGSCPREHCANRWAVFRTNDPSNGQV